MREDEIAAGRYAIPGHDKPGYNGVTGASATWNAELGMWVDSNGEKIRDDAIVTTPPAPSTPAASAAPATPETPAAASNVASAAIGGGGGGSSSSGGGYSPAMSGLLGALPGGGNAVAAPGKSNLGQRSLPVKNLALAMRAPKAY